MGYCQVVTNDEVTRLPLHAQVYLIITLSTVSTDDSTPDMLLPLQLGLSNSLVQPVLTCQQSCPEAGCEWVSIHHPWRLDEIKGRGRGYASKKR